MTQPGGLRGASRAQYASPKQHNIQSRIMPGSKIANAAEADASFTGTVEGARAAVNAERSCVNPDQPEKQPHRAAGG